MFTAKPKTEQLPMLPLRDVVVFPHMMIPFVVGRASSIEALENATRRGNKIFLCAQTTASTEEPTVDDVHKIGTVATIIQTVKQGNGNYRVLVEGLHRARLIGGTTQAEGYIEVRTEAIDESFEPDERLATLLKELSEKFEKYIKVSQTLSLDTMLAAIKTDDPAKLTDTIASQLPIESKEKQKLLEIINPVERIEAIITLLTGELDKVSVDKKINNRVRKQIEKAQKEYYLNEKIKAIQKELGRGDKGGDEFLKLKKAIIEAKMTDEANEKALHELEKLEAMPPTSAEATVSRNYIDWLVSVPWNKRSRDSKDLKRAKDILDTEHFGLDKVKERILEYLAVRTLVKKMEGTIICFQGAPGVGKSTLARSIAKALNRKFVRFSLGGVRDEAEIRGHRRTYIGALPGQMIQMMKKAGTVNPVILLDEIDKMSTDFRGDPASALMEVLDPELNSEFSDHFLDVSYNMSQVMFLTTANVIHTIPRPLLDRMEIINIPGYTISEKIEIIRRHLLPKQLKAHGLHKKGVEISEDALRFIVEKYTWEAGLRNLERLTAKICRKLARNYVEDKEADMKIPDGATVEKYLDVPRFRKTRLDNTNRVGHAHGLAWTEGGGDVLSVEALLMRGKGGLTLTGKLGDVMQESGHAAMSLIRSMAGSLGIDNKIFSRLDAHVHVPEGGIPKDGPSAGITLTTALASAFTSIPVRADVAMTGEVTLSGRVLPIGGLKEKVMAAHRYGIKTILLPKENEKDLKDIPEEISSELEFICVETVEEVLSNALADKITPLSDMKELLDEVAREGNSDSSSKITH
jgi:ATP-dependent Lon protease